MEKPQQWGALGLSDREAWTALVRLDKRFFGIRFYEVITGLPGLLPSSYCLRPAEIGTAFRGNTMVFAPVADSMKFREIVECLIKDITGIDASSATVIDASMAGNAVGYDDSIGHATIFPSHLRCCYVRHAVNLKHRNLYYVYFHRMNKTSK